MARSKAKPGAMLESYNTTWTPQQRANWSALGDFIYRLRQEGKIGKGGADSQ